MSFSKAPLRSSITSNSGTPLLSRNPSPAVHVRRIVNSGHESMKAESVVGDDDELEQSAGVAALQDLIAQQSLMLLAYESEIQKLTSGAGGDGAPYSTRQVEKVLREVCQLLAPPSATSSKSLSVRADGNAAGKGKSKKDPPAKDLMELVGDVHSAALEQRNLVLGLQKKEEESQRVIAVLQRELRSAAQKQQEAEEDAMTADHTLQAAYDAKVTEYRAVVAKVKRLEFDASRREQELQSLRDQQKSEQTVLTALKEFSSPAGGDAASVLRGTSSRSQSSTRTPQRQHTRSSNSGSSGAVTTHHLRLFSGSDFTAAYQHSPRAFEDAIRKDLSIALPACSSRLVLRAAPRSITAEMAVTHTTRMSEDEIAHQLWQSTFETVERLADDAAAAAAMRAPTSPHSGFGGERSSTGLLAALTMELDTARSILASKEEEIQSLEDQLRRSREDVVLDEAAVDGTVMAVVQEMEKTLIALRDQLQEKTEECEALTQAVDSLEESMESYRQALEDTTSQAQAKERVSTADRRTADSLRVQVELLQDELAAVTQAKDQLDEELTATQAAAQKAAASATVTAEVTTQAVSQTFECIIPLSSLAQAEVAAERLSDHSQTDVLHALVLQHMSAVTGSVPLQLRRCVADVVHGAIKVRAELGFIVTSSKDKEEQVSRIARLLEHSIRSSSSSPSSPQKKYIAALESWLSTKNSASAVSQASLNEMAEVGELLEDALSTKERQQAASTLDRLRLLVQKVKDTEAVVQKLRVESMQVSTRLRVKESENERLRKEMRSVAASPSTETPSSTEAMTHIISSLEREVRQLKKDLADAKERERSQDELLADQNQLVEELHQQLEEHAAMVSSRSHNSSNSNEVVLLQKQMGSVEAERERLRSRIVDLEADIGDLVTIQNSQRDTNEQLQKKLKLSQGEKEAYRKRLEKQEAELRAATTSSTRTSNGALSPETTSNVTATLQETIALLRRSILKVCAPTRNLGGGIVYAAASDDGATMDVERASAELFDLTQKLDGLLPVSLDGGERQPERHHPVGAALSSTSPSSSPRYTGGETTPSTSAAASSSAADSAAASPRVATLTPGASSRYAAWVANRNIAASVPARPPTAPVGGRVAGQTSDAGRTRLAEVRRAMGLSSATTGPGSTASR